MKTPDPGGNGDSWHGKLLAIMSSFGYVSTDCRKALQETVPIKHIQAHKHLIRKGQRPVPLWIQLSGYSKGYYLTKKDHQKIFAFWNESDIVGNPDIFLRQQECRFYIECLSDSAFAEISFDTHKRLEKDFQEMIQIHEHLLVAAAQKADIKNRIRDRDSFKQYLKFCELHSYHDQLKARDIAAYLGISEQRLSNIKREHRRDLF